MRFITHKLGFLIIAAMVFSVLSITVMLPPRTITLMSLPNDATTSQTMLVANDMK